MVTNFRHIFFVSSFVYQALFNLHVTLQGCIIAMQREDGSGGSAVYEKLQEIKGDMIKAGLKFNKRTHALFVEAHILDCNTEVSFWCHSSKAHGSLALKEQCMLDHLLGCCSLPCWHLRTWPSWHGRGL